MEKENSCSTPPTSYLLLGEPSWAIAKSIGCCWPADFLFRIVRPHFGSPWRCGFSIHILSLSLTFCKVIAPTKKSFISDLPGFDGFIIRSPLFVWNGVCPQHPVFALKPMGLNPLFKQTHCWAILGGDFEGYKHGHDPEVGITTISITKYQLINLNLDRLRKKTKKNILWNYCILSGWTSITWICLRHPEK